MPGDGYFVSFCRPGSWNLALKSCPWARDFDGKKLVAQGLAWGMVTGQLDTCILLSEPYIFRTLITRATRTYNYFLFWTNVSKVMAK